MNPKIKQMWLEALRSGEYTQGAGHLRVSMTEDNIHFQDTHCCLGVLCDLHRQTTASLTNWTITSDGLWSYEGYEETLPESVVEWAGIEDMNPNINISAIKFADWYPHDIVSSANTSTLAQLNDAGASFEHIANVIEAQL